MSERADTRTVTHKAKSEPSDPDTVFGRRQLPGSVDLIHAGSLPEWGPQSARIMDVARTVDAACASILQATAEYLDEKFAKERKATSAQIADLARKLDDANARASLSELEVAKLRREISMFDRSLALDRARRAERARKPPAVAAKSKAKMNGGKPPDGATLPDFIVKSAAGTEAGQARA